MKTEKNVGSDKMELQTKFKTILYKKNIQCSTAPIYSFPLIALLNFF